MPESRLNYKLAFVRNPYDKVYSGFEQLKRDIEEQPSYQFPLPWIRDLVIAQLSDNLVQLRRADFCFDNWVRLIKEEQIYEVGRNSNFPLHPAHYWTHVGGTRLVDFVGKVENFEEDFQRLISENNIEETGSESINVHHEEGLGRPIGYRYARYRYTHLMNSASIERINRLFEADFDIFGYEKVV